MVTRAARSLLANLFFVELEICQTETEMASSSHLPEFLCEGYIRCRLRLGSKGQKPLVQKLRNDGCYFLVKGRKMQLPEDLVSEVGAGSDFALPIQFPSANPESEQVKICLLFPGDPEEFPISGFPRTPSETTEGEVNVRSALV
jgi:hypothetical protein